MNRFGIPVHQRSARSPSCINGKGGEEEREKKEEGKGGKGREGWNGGSLDPKN